MILFRCALLNKQGYVQELFYRRGSSAAAVLSTLRDFQWPAGKWEIDPV